MKKKIVALCLCIALAVVAIGGATLAYFTDQTTEVKNTFTVGNVKITLSEPSWVEDNAKMVPGTTIAKDPTITVNAGSERAYTFMKVQLSTDFAKLLKDYATAKRLDLTTNDGQNALINAWFTSTVNPKVMSINTTENYVILGVLSPKNAGESVKYFDAVKVPADVTNDMIKANGDYNIIITAYAVQASGIEGSNTNADTSVDPDANKKLDRVDAFKVLFENETIR